LNKQNYGAAKAAQDKYRKKNMEKTNERQRAWRRNNPDKTKAYHAKWYYENRESHLANLRQKRRGNPDHLEKKRKWRNKNIEKERASSRHRNMIMRAAYNAVKELGILEIIKHEIQTTA